MCSFHTAVETAAETLTQRQGCPLMQPPSPGFERCDALPAGSPTPPPPPPFGRLIKTTCAAFVQVAAVTLFQMAMCYVVKDFSWGWIFGLGWVISGFANQNLFCAQVKLAHALSMLRKFFQRQGSTSTHFCGAWYSPALCFLKVNRWHCRGRD